MSTHFERETKAVVAVTPKKNDTEKRLTEIPLYRPPALRKSATNIQSRDKER